MRTTSIDLQQQKKTESLKNSSSHLAPSLVKANPKVKQTAYKQSSAAINRSQSPKLPITGNSGALSFPNNKAEKISGNLKKCSPWYQSILDPMHGADCKIPDDCGDETGTLQCVERTIITVAGIADACSGTRSLSLYPTSTSLPNAGFYASDASSTSTNVEWNTLTTAKWSTNAALNAYSQGVRVVSAALYIQPECSLSNCSGEVCTFIGPMDNLFPTSGGPYTYDGYANHYGSTLFSLNSLKPMMVRWYPYSKQSQSYSSFYLPSAQTVGSGSSSVPFWTLGFLTKGVPAGVTFRCTYVINYEFLPSENAINILDAAPSPSDATEVGLVENWVASEPTAKQVPYNLISTPPSSVNPSQTESPDGFGMFTDVLRELVPIALEGIGTMLL